MRPAGNFAKGFPKQRPSPPDRVPPKPPHQPKKLRFPPPPPTPVTFTTHLFLLPPHPLTAHLPLKTIASPATLDSGGRPMPNKSRSEQIFDHAIKFVTPFSTTLGHPWAIVPDGPVNYRGWPLYSRRFREWLADSFQREHTVFPGLHALDSAVSMLAARARFNEFPAGQIFTRVGSTGDPRRPTSVLLHLANKNNETLEITPSGHHTRSATYLPGSLTPRLPDSHFLATASTLPLPYPIRTSTQLDRK